MTERTSHGPALELHEGDITRLALDAIVNAANSRLVPGGGVDGAINRAAGRELAEAMAAHGRCPTGEARITPGFRLPARHVIHTVGPVWKGGEAGEDDLLAACYRNSLALACEHGLQSIAFPGISTGVYGFPPERAAGIAVAAVREAAARLGGPARVVFCVFDAQAAAIYRARLAS